MAYLQVTYFAEHLEPAIKWMLGL